MSTQQLISHLVPHDPSFNLCDGEELDVHLKIVPQKSGGYLVRTVSIKPTTKIAAKSRGEPAKFVNIKDVQHALEMYQKTLERNHFELRGAYNQYYPWRAVGRLVEFLVKNEYVKAIKDKRVRRPRFADMHSRLERGLLRPQDFLYLEEDVADREEWITDEEIQGYWRKFIAYVIATTRFKGPEQRATLIAHIKRQMH